MNTRSVGRFVLCLGLFLVVTVGATAAQDAQFAASESIETQQTDAVTEVDQQVTDERPEREVGTQQADIVIQSINSPSTIAPDENLSVDYTLANQGGADGTESFVDLVVDGTSNNFDDTDADVNVSAGGTTSGTLTFDNVSGFFSDGDTINFSVELFDFGDVASGSTDVVDTQPDIVIQSIDFPSTIAPDENLSVDYTLANQGGADGTESFVDLVVDGTSNNFDDTDADVNVSAGGTTSGTLTFDNVSGFFSDGDTINFSVELWDFGDSLSGTTDIVGLPALPGHDPPNDVDGDSLYEDADGDGQFDIFDVQAFFNNYNQPEVQNHDWAYDFDSDGSVDIFDVQQMFNNL